MKNEQYRIDRSYEKVYEYSEEQNGYVFLCSFLQIGAERKNRDKTIIKKIEEWK